MNVSTAHTDYKHHLRGRSCATTGCAQRSGGGAAAVEQCEDSFPENALLLCYCSQSLVDATAYTLGITAWPWVANSTVENKNHPCRTMAGVYIATVLADYVSNLVVNIANIFLSVVVGILAIRFNRYSSLSSQTVSVAYMTFVFMVINTAAIELVTKGQLPFTLPASLADLQAIGFLGGDHQDFNRGWYAKPGGAMTTTMLTEALLGPLLTLLEFQVYWPCCVRCCVRRGMRRSKKGAGLPMPSFSQVVQSQVNDRLDAPDFDLSGRFASIMNTMTITLMFCGGLPMLMPLAAISFGITFWLDKWMLLRYYRKPAAIDGQLLSMGLHQLWLGLGAHLAFTVWMYGSEGVIHSTRPALFADPPLGISTPRTGEAFGATILARMTRWSTLPHVAALALVLVYLLLARVPPCQECAEVACHSICQRLLCRRHKDRLKLGVGTNTSARHVPSSPFTEEFCRDTRRSKGGLPLGLTVKERAAGWKKQTVDGWQVRFKVHRRDGPEHAAGDRMLTWEVIEELGMVSSYQLSRNPRYEQAVLSVGQRERLESEFHQQVNAAKGATSAVGKIGRKLSRARSKALDAEGGGGNDGGGGGGGGGGQAAAAAGGRGSLGDMVAAARKQRLSLQEPTA